MTNECMSDAEIQTRIRADVALSWATRYDEARKAVGAARKRVSEAARELGAAEDVQRAAEQQRDEMHAKFVEAASRVGSDLPLFADDATSP